MSAPQPNEEKTCPECGAALAEGASSCWLCRGTAQPDAHAPAPSSPFAERRAAYQFSLASLMLIVTLVAVLLGVFRMAPGLGVVLLIVSAPAVVRTYMVTYRRKKKGKSVSPVEKTKMYLGSLVVGLVILVVVGLASLGTFFAVCLGVDASFNAHGMVPVVPPLAALLAALVVTGLACWLMVLWVRRRWRKAVGEKNDRERVDPP